MYLCLQGAISRGLPIDELSSSRRDYQDKGKFAAVVGKQTREQASLKARNDARAAMQIARVTTPTGKSGVSGVKITVPRKAASTSATRGTGSGSGKYSSGGSAAASSAGAGAGAGAAGRGGRAAAAAAPVKRSVSVMDERLKGNVVKSGAVRALRMNRKPSALTRARTDSSSGSNDEGESKSKYSSRNRFFARSAGAAASSRGGDKPAACGSSGRSSGGSSCSRSSGSGSRSSGSGSSGSRISGSGSRAPRR